MPSQLRSERQQAAGTLLEDLLRDEREQLIRLAAARLVDSTEAEDVVQSAAASFLLAFRPSENPNGRSGALAYLKTAVAHHAFKHNRTRQRRHGRHSEFEPISELLSGDGVEPLDERLVELDSQRRALAELSQRELRILALRAAGFSTDEILARTEESPRSLRKTIERANRKLRGSLEGGREAPR
jgi:RNA polymerase sigma factor (sigma-70 family)